jgi:two-component system chemotaxis sensor kinase CheA
VERLPGFAQLDPLEAHLAWDLGLIGKVPRSKIEDTFAWVLDDCELDIRPAATAEPGHPGARPRLLPPAAAPARRHPPPAASGAAEEAETSIRVSVDKVDALINLVGELVITQAMLKQVSQRWTRSTPRACSPAWTSLNATPATCRKR